MAGAAGERHEKRLRHPVVDLARRRVRSVRRSSLAPRDAQPARQDPPRLARIGEQPEASEAGGRVAEDLRRQVRQQLHEHERRSDEAVAGIREPGRTDRIRGLGGVHRRPAAVPDRRPRQVAMLAERGRDGVPRRTGFVSLFRPGRTSADTADRGN